MTKNIHESLNYNTKNRSAIVFKQRSDQLPDQLPWANEYKVFGIPDTLEPYPDRPVYETLDHAARKFKKQGLIQLDYKMTYPEVKEHVERLATSFISSIGLQKGDRVATLLPTSIQFVIADYAISRAGLVHVPASSLEPVSILAHKFNQSMPKVLICLEDALPVVKQLIEETSLKRIIVTRIDDYSAHQKEKPLVPDIKSGVWMTHLIEVTKANLPEIDFNVDEDLELILFTGGTTGLPKGCMLTHKNIYANLLQNEWATGAGNRLVTGCLTVLLGLPFFHSYGHIVMHTMVQMGYNQILIPDSRDTDGMVCAIKKYYPLLQIGVPTQFMNICKEELDGFGMLGISGSAPLPESVQQQYEKKTKGAIMEGYGLSEMSPATHLNTSFLLRILGGRTKQRIINSMLNFPGVAAVINFFMRMLPSAFIGYVGSRGLARLVSSTGNTSSKKAARKASNEKRRTCGIPLPDTEIRLVDMETGDALSIEDIQAGKRGEMHIKGPQRMLGYWPEKGSGIDEEGYINTGDVVTVDENGYFYIVDRTKDMINVSGYKVYSREIDDILYEIPGVEHGAAVGVPDPQREGSERVVVYIEPSVNGSRKITEELVIDYLRTKVAKYAVPKAVKIINKMPLTEIHKLNKKEIRKMAENEFAADKLEPQELKTAAIN
jgi:acyl-CoA synthetase (AMP-forming)/AMP-acid ligase II